MNEGETRDPDMTWMQISGMICHNCQKNPNSFEHVLYLHNTWIAHIFLWLNTIDDYPEPF